MGAPAAPSRPRQWPSEAEKAPATRRRAHGSDAARLDPTAEKGRAARGELLALPVAIEDDSGGRRFPAGIPAPTRGRRSREEAERRGTCSRGEGGKSKGESGFPTERPNRVVTISEASLHGMIAGCPVLECLLLKDIIGCSCLRINSPTLVSIGVRIVYREHQLEELVVEDAPCLERLLRLDHKTLNVSVISAPKLETVGYFCDMFGTSRIVFGDTVIKGLRVDTLTTVMHTVKILAINMQYLCLDTIIDLLRLFPSLEKLYIESCSTGLKILWRKHRNTIKCLEIRLKTIVMGRYRGIWTQINFATFFVLNARMLELMIFQVAHGDYNERFFAEQHEMLQLEKRASRAAQFDFTTDRCINGISDFNHVHDLCLADPFIRRR